MSNDGKYYEYDVALSYAGEDRAYADILASILKGSNVKVFYDQYEKPDLWGKNLYTHLSDIYGNKARFCVMFLSQHYASKQWTRHEREAAQARAFSENQEYILPIRLDDTEIPGITSTIAYLRWDQQTPENIADAILEKLGYLLETIPNSYHSESVEVVESSARSGSRWLIDAFFASETKNTATNRKSVDSNIEDAVQQECWRHFVSQVLRLSLLLMSDHTPQPVIALVLPLEGTKPALSIWDVDHLHEIGQSLVGLLSAKGFYAYLDEAPHFEYPTDFRLQSLASIASERKNGDALLENALLIVQRRARPLKLSPELVKIVRRLLNLIYSYKEIWHFCFDPKMG